MRVRRLQGLLRAGELQQRQRLQPGSRQQQLLFHRHMRTARPERRALRARELSAAPHFGPDRAPKAEPVPATDPAADVPHARPEAGCPRALLALTVRCDSAHAPCRVTNARETAASASAPTAVRFLRASPVRSAAWRTFNDVRVPHQRHALGLLAVPPLLQHGAVGRPDDRAPSLAMRQSHDRRLAGDATVTTQSAPGPGESEPKLVLKTMARLQIGDKVQVSSSAKKNDGCCCASARVMTGCRRCVEQIQQRPNCECCQQ